MKKKTKLNLNETSFYEDTERMAIEDRELLPKPIFIPILSCLAVVAIMVVVSGFNISPGKSFLTYHKPKTTSPLVKIFSQPADDMKSVQKTIQHQ